MIHTPTSDLTPRDLDRLVSHADHLASGHAASPALDPADPAVAAWALGLAAGFDQPHARHVAALTLSIYDQISAIYSAPLGRPAPLWARPRSRTLLHLAAILHDVGCAISYRKHHKHSYIMIASSRLPGLARQELELVAVIARYHRRSQPKDSHTMYTALSDAERELVRALSGILRVGDALDRSHTQCVQSVLVSAVPTGLGLVVRAKAQPGENMDACMSKGRMLESYFGTRLSVRWATAKRRESAGSSEKLSDARTNRV